MKNAKTDVAKKQLFLVLSATRRRGLILPSTDVLHIQGLRSAPLVISQEVFEHIERGHDILVMDLFDLRENIENYVLAIWILSTYNAGLGLYANEKTERWLQSLGVQFPQSLVNSLSLNKYAENAD